MQGGYTMVVWGDIDQNPPHATNPFLSILIPLSPLFPRCYTPRESCQWSSGFGVWYMVYGTEHSSYASTSSHLPGSGEERHYYYFYPFFFYRWESLTTLFLSKIPLSLILIPVHPPNHAHIYFSFSFSQLAK